MFKVGNHVEIRFQGDRVIGRIIGIDRYKIENFNGRSDTWPSYTLIGSKKGRFARYWLVLWDHSHWILWLKSGKIPTLKSGFPVFSKSGIAKIKFKGEAGPSTPVAALMQYRLNGGYYCIERFGNSRVMLFKGYRIREPAIVHVSLAKSRI